MNSRNITLFAFIFGVLLLVQGALVAFDIALFNRGFCYIYILLLLILPVNINNMMLLGIGFFLGLPIDIFYNTLGMHMAACVLLAYARPYILKILTPQSGYDSSAVISVNQGARWFILYSFVCILLHHAVLHLLESSHLPLFFRSLWTAFLSTLFTFSVIMIIQYLFFVNRKFR